MEKREKREKWGRREREGGAVAETPGAQFT